jgi:hypothetical protein
MTHYFESGSHLFSIAQILRCKKILVYVFVLVERDSGVLVGQSHYSCSVPNLLKTILMVYIH